METHTLDSLPFGTYALPHRREMWRQRASRYKATRLGRVMISFCRKLALRKIPEPYDVEIAADVNVRLYPSGNRCEKRAVAGVQIWDAPERAALKMAVNESTTSPFIFVDVGANIGLYSLFVNGYAKAAKRAARIIAIEPGREIAARLNANITLNAANIELVSVAVSDQAGTAYLSHRLINHRSTNHGEAHLTVGPDIQAGFAEPVTVRTLLQVCEAQGLDYINAMKVDIEGHDARALRAFFDMAPTALHPELLIVETGRQIAPTPLSPTPTSSAPVSPLIALCHTHGYRIVEQVGLNTIFKKVSHV